jgi:hypothetical protein
MRIGGEGPGGGPILTVGIGATSATGSRPGQCRHRKTRHWRERDSKFAIANPDHTQFVDSDEYGILDPSQKLARTRYAWLDKNYPEGSAAIKEVKQQMNAFSHANLINTHKRLS